MNQWFVFGLIAGIAAIEVLYALLRPAEPTIVYNQTEGAPLRTAICMTGLVRNLFEPRAIAQNRAYLRSLLTGVGGPVHFFLVSDQDVDLARVAADLGFPVADFRFRKLDKALSSVLEARCGAQNCGAGLPGFYAQWSKLRVCWDLIQEREAELAAPYSHVVRMRLDNKGYGAIFPLTVVQKPHVVYARYRCCEGLGLLHQDLFANDPPNFICPPGAVFMDDQSALMLRSTAVIYLTLYDEPCLIPSVNGPVREAIVKYCRPEEYLINTPNVMSECYMTVALVLKGVKFIGIGIDWLPF